MSHASAMMRYVIPPYMLEQIKLHGPDELRTAASQALDRSDSLRQERIALQSQLASGQLSRPGEPISEPGDVGRRVFDAGGA